MSDAGAFRKIEPIPLDGLDVGEVEGDKPMVEWWNPADLRVDERYQRGMSPASMVLIQKIIAQPSWARLKPPVCALGTDGELYVIDGQHTAIACASHPGFEKIPVLIVGELDLEAQAYAFLGHNRDRIAMRPEQIFHAQVTAGDEDALTAVKVCETAGARILRNPASRGEYRAGDIIAVNPLMALVKRRTALRARQVIGRLASALDGYGFEKGTISQIEDHRMFLVIADAARYRQMQAQKSQQPGKTPPVGSPPAKRPQGGQNFREQVKRAQQSGNEQVLMDTLAARFND
jgi:hypothetical protein